MRTGLNSETWKMKKTQVQAIKLLLSTMRISCSEGTKTNSVPDRPSEHQPLQIRRAASRPTERRASAPAGRRFTTGVRKSASGVRNLARGRQAQRRRDQDKTANSFRTPRKIVQVRIYALRSRPDACVFESFAAVWASALRGTQDTKRMRTPRMLSEFQMRDTRRIL